jgi:aspartate-semialdehyde dehydrogenase
VGDEVTFIQVIGPDAFERADFTFFCGSENLTRRYWQQALRSGSTVLDLSGAARSGNRRFDPRSLAGD